MSTVSPWKVRCIEAIEGSASVSGSIVAEFYWGPVLYDDDKDRWSGRYCNNYICLDGILQGLTEGSFYYRSAAHYQKGRHHLMRPHFGRSVVGTRYIHRIGIEGPPILTPTKGPIQSFIHPRTLPPRHRSSRHHQSCERSQYGFNGCSYSEKVRLVGLE
jgi:hypothetical protein